MSEKPLTHTPHRCVTCGNEFTGKYCNACGEKILQAEERTLGHFFGEFIHLFTHADSKFLKSLKYLLLRPGFLTSEYLQGRRKLYTPPLTLFFIANLLYFLIVPLDTLNTKYVSQLEAQPYSESIRHLADQKQAEHQWTVEEISERYDAKSGVNSKLLLILLVLGFSVPVSLLFYSRNQYFFNHLVFATEFLNYLIFYILMAVPFLLFLIFGLLSALGVPVSLDVNSGGALILLLILIWGFLALAARRVYRQHWALTLVKTLLLFISFTCLVFLYRFMLFHLTIRML